VMRRYYELVSGLPPDEVEAVGRTLEAGTLHPREAKVRLGRILVARYHSAELAEAAARRFAEVFSRHGLPEDMPEIPAAAVAEADGTVQLVRLIADNLLAPSRSEARRLIQQGGVEVDGQVVRDIHARLLPDRAHVLRVGKRQFVRLLPSGRGAKKGEKWT